MNRILLIAFFATQINFGQSILPVGSFQISNDGVYNTTFTSNGVAKMDMGFDGTTGYINFGAHTGNGQNHSILNMRGNGYVGIGTVNPLFKLDVIGGARFLVPDDKSAVGGLTIETVNGTNLKIGGNSTYSWIQSHAALPLYINELGNNTILNNNTGNVGVGTTSPDEKLTVRGKIHTQEVRVDMSGPLSIPDYVFAKDYNLKTLKDVEDYIKQNNHLPEIPSAKEIEKNGLMLAEMNMSLLKKIEELTLYVIEQEKKNIAQSNEIDILKKQNQDFQMIVERVIKLENQLK